MGRPHRPELTKILKPAPWYFRFARKWNLDGRRGGHSLSTLLSRLGLLTGNADLLLPDGLPIRVPLGFSGLIDTDLFAYYEKDALDTVAAAMESMAEPPVFMDIGADFGLYTRLLLSRTRRLDRAVAVEPNRESFDLLSRNLAALDVPIELLAGAMSKEAGAGRLVFPAYDHQAQAAYLETNVSGSVDVYCVDEYLKPAPTYLALKTDVEGAELDVLTGARGCLSSARGFVVQFEAHPAVAKRTDVDPIECLRLLSTFAEINVTVCQEKLGVQHDPLSLTQPFFEQFSNEHFYDVVVCSHTS